MVGILIWDACASLIAATLIAQARHKFGKYLAVAFGCSALEALVVGFTMMDPPSAACFELLAWYITARMPVRIVKAGGVTLVGWYLVNLKSDDGL